MYAWSLYFQLFSWHLNCTVCLILILWVRLKVLRQMQLTFVQPRRHKAQNKALINTFASLCWKLAIVMLQRLCSFEYLSGDAPHRTASICRACQIKTIWVTGLFSVMEAWARARNLCKLYRMALRAFSKLPLSLASDHFIWSFCFTINRVALLGFLLPEHTLDFPMSDSFLRSVVGWGQYHTLTATVEIFHAL